MALLFKTMEGRVPDYYIQKTRAEKKIGRKLSKQEFEENYLVMSNTSSTVANTGNSIFNPVLCEISYLWFTAPGDIIIDPFAGGSVRGIVASKLERKYVGVDLREEQVEANREQGETLCDDYNPVWIVGDSMRIKDLAAGQYDFLFTCPPYGNLEVYSDDPDDISNMSDEEFDEAYSEILRRTVSMLCDNRFAVIVVGNYRDKDGYLRDLVGLTVRAMESAGARFYNDFIFLPPLGGVAMRAGKQFRASRKAGRCHQYALCFVKGDPKVATERLGEVELPDMDEYEEV